VPPAIDHPGRVVSVVAEIELLAATGSERILQESLAAVFAQIESQHAGGVVIEGIRLFQLLEIHSFEQILNLFEMVGFPEIRLVAAGIVNRLKDLDLHDVAILGSGIDRTLAQVTRVMKHERLRGFVSGADSSGRRVAARSTP
jgi:hypothetical protein